MEEMKEEGGDSLNDYYMQLFLRQLPIQEAKRQERLAKKRILLKFPEEEEDFEIKNK